jgi:hypothetical protein
MPHPDHDAILAAFRRVDPSITTCDRGDPQNGYTHIHGPSQPRGADRCNSHSVVVEKQNGTLSLRAPIGVQLGGVARAQLPISSNVLGYSYRSNYGEYGIGFDAPAVRRGWASLDDFARAVIAAARQQPGGW